MARGIIGMSDELALAVIRTAFPSATIIREDTMLQNTHACPVGNCAQQVENGRLTSRKENLRNGRSMNIKNKLRRAVGIAAAATAIGGLGLTGVASASTAAPAMKAHVSQPSSTAVPARDHSPDWYCTWWKYTTFGTWCLAYHL